jgi:ubiquinone/menaquinone biosynthesis C-methylase UbiE
MAAVGEVPDGGSVIDCPCGAAPTLRAVPTGGSIRYQGADLSSSMIRRARKRAAARGLTNAEFVEADAAKIPMASASADLFLSFWGLHCFADPPAALVEVARVLKPGGRQSGAAAKGHGR